MPDEIDDLLEQYAAAEAAPHLYKCVYCQIASAVEIILVVQDLPEGGCRATLVGLCGICGEGKND